MTDDATPGGDGVLVVGGTTSGLVLATLLARRGIDTTLASRRRGSPGTDGAVPLGLAAPDVLDGLGIVAGPDDVLTGFDQVGFDGDPLPSTGRGGAVHAEADRLRTRLRAAVPGSVSRYGGLHRLREDDGVTVRFRSGDSEGFGLVVGAGGPGSFLRMAAGVPPAAERGAGVHEWTLQVDRPPAPGTAPREFRAAGTMATATPLEGTLWARVGVAVEEGAEGPPRDRALAALERLDGIPTPPADGELSGASYRRLPDPGTDPTWRERRLAFCGAAATPFGALSGLVPSLGIEGAAVLAAAVDEHGPTEAALEQYATHRRRRLAAVREAAGRSVSPDTAADDPSARLAAVRGVALGGFPDRRATDPPSPAVDWSAENED